MSTTAPPGNSSQYVDFDEYVEFQLEKTRSSIRWTDLLTAGAAVVAGFLGYLFVFVVLDQWVIPGGFNRLTRTVLLFVWLAGTGAWLFMKLVRPWLKRINRLYAARELERAEPGLHSSLLNLIDLRDAGRTINPAVLKTLQRQTAVRLSEMDLTQAVDHRGLMRASYGLLIVVVSLCLYALLSPKKISASLWRVLPTSNVAVATRTEIFSVTPGSTKATAELPLEVTVELRGQLPPEAQVLYSTADQKYLDQPVALRPEQEGSGRYTGSIWGENGKGVLQDFTYRVVAGDAVSETYRVTVEQPPSATIEQLRLEFPPYMQLEPQVLTGGNIDSWEGAKVVLQARTNREIRSAKIEFRDKPAEGPNGEELALHVVEGRQLRGEWTLKLPATGEAISYYSIRCLTEDGLTEKDPTVYSLKVRPDQAPEVVLLQPERDLEAPANAVIPLIVQAKDPDFELGPIRLQVEKAGEVIHVQPLSPGGRPQTLLRSELNLEPFGLMPGDTVAFWVEATDNRQPRPNRKNTPKLKITVSKPVSDEEVRQQLADEKKKQEDQLADASAEQNREGRDGRPQDASDSDPRAPMPPEPAPGEERPPGEPPRNPNAGQQPDGQEKVPGTEPDPGKPGEAGRPGESTGGKPGDRKNEERQPLSPKGEDDQEVLKLLNEQLNKQPPKDPSKPSEGDQPPANQPENKPGKKPPMPGTPEGGGSGDQSQPGEKPQPGAEQKPGDQPGSEKQPGDRGTGDQPGERPGKQTTPKTGADQPDSQPTGTEPGDKPQPGAEKQPGGKRPGTEQKPGTKPDGEKSSDKPDQPGKSASKPVEKPAKGGEKPEQPGDQPGDRPGQAPGEQPGAKPGNKPGEKPGASTGKPESADSPTGDQPGPSASQPEDKPGKEGTKPGEKTPDGKPGTTSKTGEKSADPPKGTGTPAEGEKQPGGEGESADKPEPGKRPGDPKGTPGKGTAAEPMPGQGDPAGAKPAEKAYDETASNPPGKSADQNPSGGEPKGGKPGDPQSARPKSAQPPSGQTSKDPAGAGEPGESPESPPGEPGGKETGEGPGKGDSTSKPGSRQGGDPKQETKNAKPGDGRSTKPGERGAPKPGDGDAEGDQPAEPGQPGSKPKPAAGGKPGQTGEGTDPPEGAPMPGESSETGTKPGAEPGEKPAGEKPTGDQPEGKAEEGGAPQPEGQEPGQKGGEKGGEQPGGGKQPGGKKGGGSPAGGKPGENPGGAPSQGPSQNAPRTGGQGGTGSTGASDGPEVGPGDAPDPDYNRQAAELVLRKLQDDLDRGEVNPELLEKLGWTEDQLKGWSDRLAKQLQQQPAETPVDRARQMQFEEMLRQIDLRKSNAVRSGESQPTRELPQSDSRRSAPPAEYREAYEAFTRGLSKRTPAAAKPPKK